MPDGSSFGVTPGADATTSAFVGYNRVFPSLATAIQIGTLSQDQTTLGVTSGLSPQASLDIYSFDFSSGDNLKLDFVGGGLSLDGSDLVTPHVQLLDIAGNVVADNEGTDVQQSNFTQLNSADGLTAGNGRYYVKVSYGLGADTSLSQSYGFQLYSGTTYQDNFFTTALTQAYDPNLFIDAATSISPSSDLKLYTRTANLTTSITAQGVTATPVNIGTVTLAENELFVSGQATAAVPRDNYNFSVAQSGPIKLSFTNKTATAQLQVQLLDSSGKVLADNKGTDAQKAAYIYLTSGAGLQAEAGSYSVKVGFAAGELTGTPQSYNFQINQGATYSVVYKTIVNQPASKQKYSAGSGLEVYTASDTQLFSRQDFNQIGATTANAINIGWLKENSTSLKVNSRLTTADHTNYYKFTLQEGSAFKLGFNNLTDSSVLHVQILDGSGYNVLADNQGSADQQAAFAKLTSDAGLASKPGDYIVKVDYAAGADRNTPENYSFQLYSGTSYNTLNTTTASAQTIQNLLLSGGSLGYSPASAAASLLTSVQNGETLDIFSNPSLFSTKLFV